VTSAELETREKSSFSALPRSPGAGALKKLKVQPHNQEQDNAQEGGSFILKGITKNLNTLYLKHNKHRRYTHSRAEKH